MYHICESATMHPGTTGVDLLQRGDIPKAFPYVCWALDNVSGIAPCRERLNSLVICGCAPRGGGPQNMLCELKHVSWNAPCRDTRILFVICGCLAGGLMQGGIHLKCAVFPCVVCTLTSFSWTPACRDTCNSFGIYGCAPGW